MASDCGDLVRSCRCCDFSKTSKTFDEATDTHSNANCFAKIKESFADSILDAEEQIKAQENISYSDTGRVAVGNRDSVCESGGITRRWSRQKRQAERQSVAGCNRRLREGPAKSSPNPGRGTRVGKTKSD